MKEFWKDWRFWVAVAAVVLVIVCVVLWFTCREFCYASSGFLIGGMIGLAIGYWLGKKNIVQPKAEAAPKEEPKAAPKQEVRRPHW